MLLKCVKDLTRTTQVLKFLQIFIFDVTAKFSNCIQSFFILLLKCMVFFPFNDVVFSVYVVNFHVYKPDLE